jgi:DivIVA domain-containing protein
VGEDKRKAAEAKPEPSAARPGEDTSYLAVRDHVPGEIRNVSFPVSMRGYDRPAVDAYIKRVNRVIAELEVSRSPQAAVKNALERVGEQTIAILREARESAEKIVAAAREEADQSLAEAKAQAADLVVSASSDAERERAAAAQTVASAKAEASEIVAQARAEAEKIVADATEEAKRRKQRSDEEIAAREAEAEARMRDLQSDTDAVWSERDALLDEVRSIGAHLHDVAASAAARVSAEKKTAPAEDEQAADAEADAADTVIAEPSPRA